jgi:hypothetical protein
MKFTLTALLLSIIMCQTLYAGDEITITGCTTPKWTFKLSGEVIPDTSDDKIYITDANKDNNPLASGAVSEVQTSEGSGMIYWQTIEVDKTKEAIRTLKIEWEREVIIGATTKGFVEWITEKVEGE